MAIYTDALTTIVGRSREREVLDRAHASTDAELVALYGRRRVGKTFLVREHYGEAIWFELTGMHDAPVRKQLQNFAHALATAARTPRTLPAPRDWLEAFRMLSAHLDTMRAGGRRRVLFFDELPWLAGRRSGFLQAFERFWNSWAVKRRDLVVVVCGYVQELRGRRETFRRTTHSRKTLMSTFVTTFGVHPNAWRDELVDREITTEALFAE